MIVKVIGRPSLKGSAATPQEDAEGKRTLLGPLTSGAGGSCGQSSLWVLSQNTVFKYISSEAKNIEVFCY